jgi:preprotein translocase subunit SecG
MSGGVVREEVSLLIYLNIIQIIISIALIALTVMQSRGAGLGRMFGSDSSIQTTRRGIDKTLYNVTIILAVIFFLVSLASVLLQS